MLNDERIQWIENGVNGAWRGLPMEQIGVECVIKELIAERRQLVAIAEAVENMLEFMDLNGEQDITMVDTNETYFKLKAWRNGSEDESE